MGEHIKKMLAEMMPAIVAGDKPALREIAQMDDQVDVLHGHIVGYLGRISRLPLTQEQTRDFLSLMEAVNDLENIGDTIETNLVDLGYDRINAGVAISDPTRKVLGDFHEVIKAATTTAIEAVANNDIDSANKVIAMKAEITRLSDSAAVHEASRLVAQEPNRIPAYTIEIDIIEKQKRIYYFAKRMAKTVAVFEDPKEASPEPQPAT